MLINKTESFDQPLIASSFNDYFFNVGPNLAAKIPSNSIVFTEYLNNNANNCLIPEKELSL